LVPSHWEDQLTNSAAKIFIILLPSNSSTKE
jgi:hypothetical protein